MDRSWGGEAPSELPSVIHRDERRVVIQEALSDDRMPAELRGDLPRRQRPSSMGEQAEEGRNRREMGVVNQPGRNQETLAGLSRVTRGPR